MSVSKRVAGCSQRGVLRTRRKITKERRVDGSTKSSLVASPLPPLLHRSEKVTQTEATEESPSSNQNSGAGKLTHQPVQDEGGTSTFAKGYENSEFARLIASRRRRATGRERRRAAGLRDAFEDLLAVLPAASTKRDSWTKLDVLRGACSRIRELRLILQSPHDVQSDRQYSVEDGRSGETGVAAVL